MSSRDVRASRRTWRWHDLDDRIASLHRAGWTATRIAAQLGCSSRTVYRWRTAHAAETVLLQGSR